MRFRYDSTRPKYDVVTAIEIGDLDRGYTAIDITDENTTRYSLTCSLYVGMFLAAIPMITKGQLPLVAKNRNGQALASKVEALETPRGSTPDLLPPSAAVDPSSVVTKATGGAVQEIKEWEAIMDHLRGLPVKNPGEFPTLVIDERAREVRAIKVG
jgi:5'-nucleotidase / UDP-sugar diphosphatase